MSREALRAASLPKDFVRMEPHDVARHDLGPVILQFHEAFGLGER